MSCVSDKAHFWSITTIQCMYFGSWLMKELDRIQEAFREHSFRAGLPAGHERGIRLNRRSFFPFDVPSLLNLHPPCVLRASWPCEVA